MSDVKAELQLIGTRMEPSGFFHLSYGTEPSDTMPFILTLTPEYVARAIGKSSESFTPRQYQETADLFRSIARTLGIRPHELQACVWAQIRREWADER